MSERPIIPLSQAVETIKTAILQGQYETNKNDKDFVELVIQGYKSPMGVATYTTSADMPEELRKALPDMEDLRRVLSSPATTGTKATVS